MGIAKLIFQDLLGWKIEGSFDREVKKAVVIVVPHTSWHDFFVGVFTRRILNVEINYVAKKELFRWPFGAYFRWMGGASLDRTPGQNKVEAIANVFATKDEFRLAMAPEGTRKKVTEWKTGYYYIAEKANVPIICCSFSYPNRTVTIDKAFYPTGNLEKDSVYFRSFFKGVIGKKPEYS